MGDYCILTKLKTKFSKAKTMPNFTSNLSENEKNVAVYSVKKSKLMALNYPGL